MLNKVLHLLNIKHNKDIFGFFGSFLLWLNRNVSLITYHSVKRVLDKHSLYMY